jgi:hypothetical protein
MAYRLLVGKPEGKRPLGRPRCRWVDNIRMNLGEVGWGDVDWIGLAKDRNRWRWDGVMWTGLVWLRIGTGGEVGWGDVDWISLAKDRNRWRAVVNWVLNLRVP